MIWPSGLRRNGAPRDGSPRLPLSELIFSLRALAEVLAIVGEAKPATARALHNWGTPEVKAEIDLQVDGRIRLMRRDPHHSCLRDPGRSEMFSQVLSRPGSNFGTLLRLPVTYGGLRNTDGWY